MKPRNNSLIDRTVKPPTDNERGYQSGQSPQAAGQNKWLVSRIIVHGENHKASMCRGATAGVSPWQN